MTLKRSIRKGKRTGERGEEDVCWKIVLAWLSANVALWFLVYPLLKAGSDADDLMEEIARRLHEGGFLNG